MLHVNDYVMSSACLIYTITIIYWYYKISFYKYADANIFFCKIITNMFKGILLSNIYSEYFNVVKHSFTTVKWFTDQLKDRVTH